MSGKKTIKKMKKFRTWTNVQQSKGETNEEKSKTMPDLHNDPRTTLENHIRGINPITGQILDRQQYYGDAIMPYQKDLTFEENRLRREALLIKANKLNDEITARDLSESKEETSPGTKDLGDTTTV